MPLSSVGWRPSKHAVFAEVAPPLGRHAFRGPSGRFRRATPQEARAQDIREAIALTASRGDQFGVFAGRLTDRRFAVRRGITLELNQEQVRAVINSTAARSLQMLYNRLVQTSPVDTGLLRSQWRATDAGISNSVPYWYDTEYVNRSSRGYTRRAVAWTMSRIRVQHPRGGLVRGGMRQEVVL